MSAISVLLDGLLIVLLLLAAYELHTARRQRARLAEALAEAIEALEKSARMLNEATRTLENSSSKKPAPVTAKAASQPPAASAALPRILQLARAGLDAQAIAKRLDIPRAEVELALRVHGARR